MIKSLSLLRIQCQQLTLSYPNQAVSYGTILNIKMSRSSEETPPIGAFVINPLSISCKKASKDYEDNYSKKDITFAHNKIEVDEKGDSTEKVSVSVLSQNCNENVSCSINRSTSRDKNVHRTVQSESKSKSLSHKGSNLNIKQPQVSCLKVSGPKCSSMSNTNTSTSNTLMMKVAASGPPKGKKTVLPPTLLQGVTELVKKQQVDINNDGGLGTVNKEDLEFSKIKGARTDGIELKYEALVDKESKLVDTVVGCSKGNVKSTLLKKDNESVSRGSLEKGDSTKVSFSNSGEIVSSGCTLIEGALGSPGGLHISKSVSSKQFAERSKLTSPTLGKSYKETNASTNLERQDKVNETANSTASNEPNNSTQPNRTDDIWAKSEDKVTNSVIDVCQDSLSDATDNVSDAADKNSFSYSLKESGIKSEVNSFSEIDMDVLMETDFSKPDLTNDSNKNVEASTTNCDAEFELGAKELLHIDASLLGGKKVSKQEDDVYNLSDLFSGELEQRRKKELKKQKRKAKNWERFSKRKKKADSADTSDKTETEEKDEKPRKPVPNYFVAIQITDQKIKSGLKAVQDKVIAENKKLQPALNKLATLHLTMMVLSLKTEEDMDRSKKALDKASEKLLSQYTDMSLELDVSGLGHFRNNVVFAKVKHEHQVSSLQNVADIVEECFMEQEIVSPDQRGFKPHITIMKLSSVKGPKKKGLRKIEEKLYSDFVDTDFGVERISMLQLCAMMKPKDKQGYYQVEHKVPFAKIHEAEQAPICPGFAEEKSEEHVEVIEESKEDEKKTSLVKEIEAEEMNMTQIDLVGEESNKAEQLEDKESKETDLGNKSTKDSLDGVLGIINDNDSAIDISIDTGTHKVKEITEKSSTSNDSGLDISVDIETPNASGIDVVFDSDSILDTSLDVQKPKSTGNRIEMPNVAVESNEDITKKVK